MSRRGVFKVGDGFAMAWGLAFRTTGLAILDGVGPPTSGTTGTGAGVAGPGSVYFQTNGQQWVNQDTKANPSWVGRMPSASISPSSSASASASSSVSPSPSSSPSSSASASVNASASVSPL